MISHATFHLAGPTQCTDDQVKIMGSLIHESVIMLHVSQIESCDCTTTGVIWGSYD